MDAIQSSESAPRDSLSDVLSLLSRAEFPFTPVGVVAFETVTKLVDQKMMPLTRHTSWRATVDQATRSALACPHQSI